MTNHSLVRDPGLPVTNPTVSQWQLPPNESFQAPVDLPEQRDLIVIGSGVTGCSVAWHLLHHSDTLKVAVVDARGICSGATGRNGGRINCTAVHDFDKYSKIFGRDAAIRIVRFELAHYQAIRAVVERVGPHLVDQSEIRWINAVNAVFDDGQVNELRRMLKSFEEALPDLRGRWKVIGKHQTMQDYGISNASGALVGEAGAAWPYRMINGIFEHLKATFPERLSFAPHTPVQSISRQGDDLYPYAIHTPKGVIRAQHVFHCTEGHAAHLLPGVRGILVPRRAQMSVQDARQLPILRDRLQSWSLTMQGVFDYATVNARTGTVWIGGGEDQRKEYSMGISSDAENDLLALSHLGGVLPVAFSGHIRPGENRPAGHNSTVQASWTGIIAHSIDHVPLVGMVPRELLDRPAGSSTSAEWISAGYGGYGMVNAFLCGRAVAMMALGKSKAVDLPDAYVLTPSRARAMHSALHRASSTKHQHIQAML